MCSACVAEGAAYVGGAVAGLRLWSLSRRYGVRRPGRSMADAGERFIGAPEDETTDQRLPSLSSHSPTTADQNSG